MTNAPTRILIVDDDVALAKSLAAMLEMAGAFETRVVHRAADAVAAAVAHPPAIVFLDIELPDMSGYVLRRMISIDGGLLSARRAS
jgi:DNA-binding response OmpR family regulator